MQLYSTITAVVDDVYGPYSPPGRRAGRGFGTIRFWFGFTETLETNQQT